MVPKTVLVCRVAAAIIALAGPPCLGASPDPLVDGIFEAWDTPDSPGCALGVRRDGAMAYARGYGSANLALGTPITPDAVFDIGSVSKQFTAMSIVLLAQDGKLRWRMISTRSFRNPPYGSALTLRTLLHDSFRRHSIALRHGTRSRRLPRIPARPAYRRMGGLSIELASISDRAARHHPTVQCSGRSRCPCAL
jgi:hypothetical protein